MQISGLAFDKVMGSPEKYRWESVTVVNLIGVWKRNMFCSWV